MEVSNIFDLMRTLSLEDAEILRFLKDCSLVRDNFRCPVGRCRRYCKLHRRERSPLGFTFYCLRCRASYSIFKGSFFEQRKLPVRLIIFLLWEWACEVRSGCAAMSAGCKRAVVLQEYRSFRNICSWKLLQNDELFLFGGLGHVLQIDVSVTKRKRNVRQVMPEKWVLGIYDVTAKRGYVVFIPDRCSETLEYHIQKHVLPGSEIWSDYSPGYSGLSNLNGVSPYIHRMVDHLRNFVDPDTGEHINYIERQCLSLKQYLLRLGVMQSPYIAEYIDQFMWKQFYGSTPADRFHNIINQISLRYGFR